MVMSIELIIIIASLVLIVVDIFFLVLTKSLFAKVTLALSVAILGIGAGITIGERPEAHLPNVENLCKGSVELSWQVYKSDVGTIKDELLNHAKCDVRFSQVPTPSAFPEHK